MDRRQARRARRRRAAAQAARRRRTVSTRRSSTRDAARRGRTRRAAYRAREKSGRSPRRSPATPSAPTSRSPSTRRSPPTGRARRSPGTRTRPGGAGSRVAVVPLPRRAAARAAGRLRSERPTPTPRGSPRAPPADGGSRGPRVAPEPRTPTRARRATPAIEAPAEDRAFAWVELVAIDADGAPLGATAEDHLRPRSSGTGVVRSRRVRQSAGSSTSWCATRRRRAKGRGACPSRRRARRRRRRRADDRDRPERRGRGARSISSRATRGDARGSRSSTRRIARARPRSRRRRAPLGPPSVEDALEGPACSSRPPHPPRAGPRRASSRLSRAEDGALFRDVACIPARSAVRSRLRRPRLRACKNPAPLPSQGGIDYVSPVSCHCPVLQGPPLPRAPRQSPRLSSRLACMLAAGGLTVTKSLRTRAHSSIGQSPRLITGLFLVRTQVGPRRLARLPSFVSSCVARRSRARPRAARSRISRGVTR